MKHKYTFIQANQSSCSTPRSPPCPLKVDARASHATNKSCISRPVQLQDAAFKCLFFGCSSCYTAKKPSPSTLDVSRDDPKEAKEATRLFSALVSPVCSAVHVIRRLYGMHPFRASSLLDPRKHTTHTREPRSLLMHQAQACSRIKALLCFADHTNAS